MVERVDEISEVFAHAAAHVPGALLEFGLLVDQVCCDDLVELAFRIGFIKFLDSISEESEGLADENSAGFSFLEGSGHFNNAVAGGEHIVDDDHILAFDA